jgi:prepilin-type N-terminal cleavage/methylation domain-containing protein
MKAWAQKQKGFTIVELLIVIVVIAILAAITIVAYNGIQNRAKDGARDNAVSTIRKVLEQYKIDEGQYPNICGTANAGCNISLLSSFAVPKYVASIPNDPESSKPIAYVINSTSDGYGLLVRYQSKPECKYLVGTNTATGWWGTAMPTC